MKTTTNRTFCESNLTTNLTIIYSEKAFVGSFRFPIRRCFGSAESKPQGLFLFDVDMQIELPKNHNFKNLTGQKFNLLTVVEFAGIKGGHSYWKCLCECGKETFATGTNLKTNHIKSCGCYASEASRDRKLTHGLYHTPERRSFQAAKNRCQNPNNKAYSRYGGRGIEFRFNSVLELIDEIGFKPSSKHSLDRIDNDGHYERGNVRWADAFQQNQNKRSSIVVIDGVRKTKKQWAEFLGIPHGTIVARVKRGWCEKCIVRPSHSGKTCTHKK